MSATTRISYAQFAAWVQDALNHLYDSPRLQDHPLAGLLAEQAATHVQRGQNLRRLLINAILAMSPEPGTPAQSPDWRAYRILELHFIEGQPPGQVMKALGLGRTLYFKEKARMVEALTRMLWERRAELFSLEDAQAASLERDGVEELTSIQAQIERLSLGQVLDELCAMVAPLAQAKGRALVCMPADVDVHADRVLLRQAILDVIGHLLETPDVSVLTMEALADARARGVRISLQPASARPALPESALATQLMRLMGGEVVAQSDEIRLVWPAAGAPIKTLLVIDDNAGLIRLFRRYLTGHAWQVIGAGNLAEALTATAESAPDAVVLDVMLPGQDGWEVLRALKAHERTRRAPVIICSVMHQPELAAQLGAAGYLKKPVTQAQLLQALAALA
ncbi:MAG: response regulator [Anaerolineae bacterium]|nr:response regulator [Candidatus Roseilinea sp.]MDW8448605.1 response regulator [Anaerolineae bacterium]